MRLPIIAFTFILLTSNSILAGSWAERGATITSIDEIKRKRSWLDLGDKPRESVKQLVSIMESSKGGAKLIARARIKSRKSGKSLYDTIEAGNVSLTDTTLVRKFAANDPFNISYEAQSKVLIDSSHTVKDAVLDLVHELVHYTFKRPFNPYKGTFKISEFMKDTIEGRGGEVEAFLVECKIGKEIFGSTKLSAQCQTIIGSNGRFSRELAVAEFYKLGAHYDKFMKSAKENNLDLSSFEFVSKESGVIISSAWGSPYPMAIIDEYDSIIKKVCRNDKRRLSYYAQGNSRSPASEYHGYKEAKLSFARRCNNI